MSYCWEQPAAHPPVAEHQGAEVATGNPLKASMAPSLLFAGGGGFLDAVLL